MRNIKESVVEKFRIVEGDQKSPNGAQFGSFLIPTEARQGRHGPPQVSALALCWADDGGKTNWETVVIRSVQERKGKKTFERLPKLEEILLIKGMFWDDGEAAMIHVSDSVIAVIKPRGKQPDMPHCLIKPKTELCYAQAPEV